MIKKSYIAFLESDIKLLVFLLAIILLLFSQNNLMDFAEEFEIEKNLVEDFDTESETEEKPSSEKNLNDEFIDVQSAALKSYLGLQTELMKQNHCSVLSIGYLIEIPIPPPEV